MKSNVVPPPEATKSMSLEDLARAIGDKSQVLEKVVGITRPLVIQLRYAAIDLGNLLSQAKKLVGHGQFVQWLELNVPSIPARTARRYMQIAKESTDDVSGKYLRQLHPDLGVVPSLPTRSVTLPARKLDTHLKTAEKWFTSALAEAMLPNDEQIQMLERIQHLLEALQSRHLAAKTATCGHFEKSAVPAAEVVKGEA